MRLLCIVLFPFFSLCAHVEIELGVCAIFKHDVHYLPEWIEFHEKQGVQKFWLYNNGIGGKVDYIAKLSPYMERGLVEVIEWPFSFDTYAGWDDIQYGSYHHCLRKIRRICKWCAFIDTDEFLFSPTGKSLPDILEDFDEFAAVGVNWVMYGTSSVLQIPEGEKMTNHLLYRSQLDDVHNLHTKSIVKPNKVIKTLNPHWFLLQEGNCKVNEQKEVFEGPFTESVSVNTLRINHYWSRDMNFFQQVKLPSITRTYGNVEGCIKTERERFNLIYDPIIIQFN